MRLRDSNILKISLRKLFPFILMFSFYLVAYGTGYPGGGFQAGVASGTIVVMYGFIFNKEHFSDSFYKINEFFTLSCFILLIISGIFLRGSFFLHIKGLMFESIVLSNLFTFFLNTMIFFEVSSSIILIFRNIMKGKDDE